MEIHNAQLGQKIQETIAPKRLNDDVNELILGGDMRIDELFELVALLNEVAINLDVLGLFMEDGIRSNV